MKTNASKPHLLIPLDGLIFAIGFPLLPLTRWLQEFGSIGHLVRYELTWWAATLLLLVYARRVENTSWRQLGFTRLKKGDWLLVVVAALGMLLILAAVYYLLFPLLRITESTQINQLLQTPLWWRILSTVRAAVSEEVFYRGFGLQEVERLMGGKWIGAAVSLAFFTLAHAPAWGWMHLIPAFLGGLLLTLLFLRRRNLWVNMACHFLVDLTAVL
jgi:membrane protease YdiL (CAAX protease family)